MTPSHAEPVPHGASTRIRAVIVFPAAGPADWQQRVVDRLAETEGVDIACILTVDPGTAQPSGADQPRAGRRDAVPTRLIADRIRAHNGSLVIDFSSADGMNQLANAVPHGIWRYHFGDALPVSDRATAPGKRRSNGSGATAYLVRLTPVADAVRLLRTGHARARSVAAAVSSLQQLCTHWPAQLILEHMDGHSDAFEGVAAMGFATDRAVSTSSTGRVSYVAGALRDAAAAARALFRHEQWNVGILDRPIETLLDRPDLRDVQWLPQPGRTTFVADPFGVERDGTVAILGERLDYRDNRGTIVALRDAQDVTAPVCGLGPTPPVHLSYPYLVEDAGEIYCIPESVAAREVAIYRCLALPDRWQRVGPLISGLPLIDATVAQFAGRWWLWASSPAGKGANCELHVWHADRLLGPWHPHAANPVKIDVGSARPGGTPFVRDGRLYRPAQDCSRVYGGRIAINRVDTMTTRVYRETTIAFVDPVSPYAAGVHTLSAAGSRTLVDGKRMVLAWPELLRTARNGLESLLRPGSR